VPGLDGVRFSDKTREKPQKPGDWRAAKSPPGFPLGLVDCRPFGERLVAKRPAH